MKILVLATDYPRPDGYIQLMYVHVRNLYYDKNNIDVTVLNFNTKENYTIDGIRVITLNEYRQNIREIYDILICHAPNIRNHYRFLNRYQKQFPKIVFFFHGHEVVRLSKVYPKPYVYKSNLRQLIKKHIIDAYDSIKLSIWNNYFSKEDTKIHIVFVSETMRKDFLRWTRLNQELIADKSIIINNSIGEIFERRKYDPKVEKIYDFITIRNNLDSSVYCIDLVDRLARRNKDKNFLVIGKGDYFKYNQCPENIILIERYLNHEEMLSYINQSKCALMLTRRDTQGVMACELATYGIPVITSNLEVCQEILGQFKNVDYISNDDLDINLEVLCQNLLKKSPPIDNSIYYQSNTCSKEVILFNKLMQEGK